MPWDSWGGSWSGSWGLSWTGDHAPVAPPRRLNLGGYVQQPPAEKKTVAGAARIAAGVYVRAFGRKADRAQEDALVLLMLSS